MSREPCIGRPLRLVSSASAALVLLACVAGAQVGPLGSEFQVNTYTTGNQLRPAIAADAAGNFVVVWESNHLYLQPQDGSGSGVFGRRYDAMLAPLGAEFQVNTYTTSEQVDTAVAVDGAGNFVVVWTSGTTFQGGPDGSASGVFGRRYDAMGAPLGSEFQVNTYTTFYQERPAVAADAAGNFVVVWDSGGGSGQDGSGRGVFGQRYDAMGAPLGSEFQVNTFTTGTQFRPAVAADGTGKFVVVWTSSAGFVGQRYDATGAPLGGEFVVAATGFQFKDAAVAADGAGNFVVVWPTAVDVFARRYDATGVPLGSEFQVNTYAGQGPAVAADAAGNFVVVWGSAGGGVFARRYDATGAPLGSEFQVNTSSHPVSPAVAAAAGSFVVAWQGGDVPYSGGVFGKLPSLASPIIGKRLRLRDGSDPAKRRLVFHFKDATLDTSPGSGLDPVTNGAVLHVYNAMGGPDSVCASLPAGGWTASGDPASPTYDYRDLSSANGPCRKARMKNGELRGVCSGREQPLTYSLDEATQGTVAVRFESGAVEHCTEFGGRVLRDEPGAFLAKDARASCGVPAPGCP